MKINGVASLASALALAGTMLTLGFQSSSTKVQVASLICAAVVVTVVLAVIALHDAFNRGVREKTMREAVKLPLPPTE